MRRYALFALVLTLALGCSDDDSNTNNVGSENSQNSMNSTNNVADMGADQAVDSACVDAITDPELSDPIFAAIRNCFDTDSAECAADDATVNATVDAYREGVLAGCDEAAYEAFQSGDVTRADWAARAADAHLDAARALARKAFGGPNGVVIESANRRDCAFGTYDALVEAHQSVLATGFGCEAADCAAPQAPAGVFADAASAAREACGFGFSLITETEESLGNLGLDQTACTAAAIRADALGLSCGPEQARTVFSGEPGVWTQVTLDAATYGSMCADGSDYSFWLKLGALDKVVVDLQGGGVCLQEGDCRARANEGSLFRSDDDMPGGRILADGAENAFAAWTMVYLPYCTQDVFTGGGVTETFGTGDEAFDVQRYGAVNAREAMKFTRDVLWQRLDAAQGTHYRNDAMTAILGGTSAGGFGTYYNHAWVIDELGWTHTMAMPRVWLSISAEPPFTLESLLRLKREPWAVANVMPTYCNDGDCAEGLAFIPIHTARLDRSPMQHIMSMSSQADTTQAGTTFHESVFKWSNLAREYYCELQGTPNVNFFLYANSDVYQAMIDGGNESGHAPDWDYTIAMTTAMDWMAAAVDDPATIQDFVNEGDMATVTQDAALTGMTGYEPIAPFACDVTE